MDKLRVSYSQVSTFLGCRMAWHWAYQERLIPKEKPVPLQVGDILHQLFHLYYEGKIGEKEIANLDDFVKGLYPQNDPSVTMEVAMQAAGLFSGYFTAYADDRLELVSSEIHLEVETPIYVLYGKIDGLVRPRDKKLFRLERKTSAMMDSAFLSGLRKGLQAGIYDHLVRENIHEKLWGTIYDILVKTKVPQYHRNPVPVSLPVIDRALKTVEGVCQDILTCMIKPSMVYPSSQCFTYNRECDYIHLCNYDSPEVRESFYQAVLPEAERR